MSHLDSIHRIAREKLQKHFDLTPVALKYPFPSRPVRALGLIRMDGAVFCTAKLQRIVCLKIHLPVYVNVFSTFIRPRLEYDLPVFSCEVARMGSKKMFLVDVHRTGDPEKDEDKDFFDSLERIRDHYKSLLSYSKRTGGEGIQSVFSRAVCQVTIPGECEPDAVALFCEYLDAYSRLVSGQAKLTGDLLTAAQADFDRYLKTVIDHDPGVKGIKLFYGAKNGVERAMDIFYGL